MNTPKHTQYTNEEMIKQMEAQADLDRVRAAAPELLESLSELYLMIGEAPFELTTEQQVTWDRANAVILKAAGKLGV